MRSQLRVAAISVVLIGAAVIVAQPRGTLDPPAGPVQPTSPSLADLMTAIEGVGGAEQSTAFPGDALFAGVGVSVANQSVFFQVAGVTGDVTSPPTHAGWISATSVAQVVTHPPGSATQFGNFRILAPIDRAFPPLMQRAVVGTAISEVNIEYLQTFPSGPVRYLRVRLNNAQFVGVTPIFQARACIYELSFARIEWRYTPLNASGQPTGADIVFCWDRQTNQLCGVGGGRGETLLVAGDRSPRSAREWARRWRRMDVRV